MKGFALDERGDLLIENGVIQMVHGVDLTMQKIKSVLGTQKGEWFLDWEEGINYDEILGKKRYASQKDGITSQYIDEINSEKQKKQELNKLLEKRLDGVI